MALRNCSRRATSSSHGHAAWSCRSVRSSSTSCGLPFVNTSTYRPISIAVPRARPPCRRQSGGHLPLELLRRPAQPGSSRVGVTKTTCRSASLRSVARSLHPAAGGAACATSPWGSEARAAPAPRPAARARPAAGRAAAPAAAAATAPPRGWRGCRATRRARRGARPRGRRAPRGKPWSRRRPPRRGPRSAAAARVVRRRGGPLEVAQSHRSTNGDAEGEQPAEVWRVGGVVRRRDDGARGHAPDAPPLGKSWGRPTARRQRTACRRRPARRRTRRSQRRMARATMASRAPHPARSGR